MSFRDRPNMLVLPHTAPLNTPVCERSWLRYDLPAKYRIDEIRRLSGRERVSRRQAG